MKRVLLTPNAFKDFAYMKTMRERHTNEEFAKAVAEAQLKNVAEWGNEYCTEHFVGLYDIPRRRCWDCWINLLKEAGMEE